MQVTLQILTALLMVTGPVWAQRPSFPNLFKRADLVIVGEVERGRRIPNSDSRSAVRPERPVEYAPVFACENGVVVKAVLTPTNGIATGTRIPILWFLPSPDCEPSYADYSLLGHDALLLLRTEGKVVRPIFDNPWAAFPLREFSSGAEKRLARWGSPVEAVTYLILTPGAVIPRDQYALSSLPSELTGLGGWATLLKAYSAVYTESDEQERGQISLVVSSFGLCTNRATETVKSMRIDSWQARRLLDSDVQSSEEDVTLSQMAWTNKQDLLSTFATDEEAVDELTLRSCSSSEKVRRRAQELLSGYFGLDPSKLPCIPCEAK